jgi:hypothetical protein
MVLTTHPAQNGDSNMLKLAEVLNIFSPHFDEVDKPYTAEITSDVP